VLLGGWTHRLHRVSVGGPSLVNLVRVHDRPITTFPERLLETDTAATAATLTTASLGNGHGLRVNGLFDEAPFVI